MIKAALAVFAVVASMASAQSIAEIQAIERCPTFGARSKECNADSSCTTVGDRCVYDCASIAGVSPRKACTNLTYCAPRSQDTGATSSSCRFKCTDIDAYDKCFQAGDQCVWYDGQCRSKCDYLNDKTACSSETTVCTNNWPDTGTTGVISNLCASKCSLGVNEWSCNQWLGDGCSWNAGSEKCEPTCTGLSEKDCNYWSEFCEFKYFKCYRKCYDIDEKNKCEASNCRWMPGQTKDDKWSCKRPCDQIFIPRGNPGDLNYPWDKASNVTNRAACMDHALCGGITDCQVANCSLYKDQFNCEQGTKTSGGGQECYWFGKNNNEGRCMLSCPNQLTRKGECITKIKGDVDVCTISFTGAWNDVISSCTNKGCESFTTYDSCKDSWSNCMWSGKGQTGSCVSQCSSRSVAGGTSSVCAQSFECAVVTRNAGGSSSCVTQCERLISKRDCQTATDCHWDDDEGVCFNDCLAAKQAKECEAMGPRCQWVNNSKAQACVIRCDNFINSQDCGRASQSGCEWTGNKDVCGCRIKCEYQTDDVCQEQCFKSSKWGDYCLTPAKPSRDDRCTPPLTNAEVAALVVGIIILVLIIILIVWLVIKAAGGAAAGGGSGGDAGVGKDAWQVPADDVAALKANA